MKGGENLNDISKLSISSATKRRKNIFNADEKKILYSKIKNLGYPPSHSNNLEVSAAWREIAESMEKSVAECKKAWKSLRLSRRYRTESNKKRNSCDAGGIIEPGTSLRDIGHCEFAGAFNEVVGSSTSTDTKCCEQTPHSKYRFVQAKHTQDPSQELISKIKKFVDMQMKVIAQKGYEKYAYMDYLLKKLPVHVAEELTFNFICRIKHEITRHNSEN